MTDNDPMMLCRHNGRDRGVSLSAALVLFWTVYYAWCVRTDIYR